MNYQHFSIQEVAGGVFAAVHKEGGGAYSNAGLIDLGDSTLVFDTFESVSAGRELLEASKALTGRAPKWVVISHKHGDHWAGNQVLAEEAIIIATHLTRSGMLGRGAEMEKMKSNPADLVDRIRGLEEKLLKETDPQQQAILERSLNKSRYALADLPSFRFCPPTMTFSGTLVFPGTRRNVELITVGPAHTPEECYLRIPGDPVIFTGDLAFFECPPFMAQDCSLEGWLDMLEFFINSENDHFVPGHGRLGEKCDLQRQQEYIRQMRKLVSEAMVTNPSLEHVLAIPEPGQFKDWGSFPQRHENNLRTLFFQQSGNKKGG